jgi:hypothetical protein
MSVPALKDKPAIRRKARFIGLVLGLASCILLLVGYIRILPVLKNYTLLLAIQTNDFVAARTAIRQGANVNAWVVEDETI